MRGHFALYRRQPPALNWHTYTLEWFPHRLDVWVDGIRYFSFRDEFAGWTKWPFDQRFHLMLNIAVGGWGGAPNFTSETMEVDHVRVFPYTGASQVPVDSAQWFRLVNRQSGKVLDVAGPSNADGANIHQWAWLGANSQQWRFEPGADGSYKVINHHSGKLPDVADGSWANGDGTSNLLAYAAGLDPWTRATAANGGVPFATNATGYLALTFVRLKNAPDLTHTVEVSPDLATWNSGPGHTTQLSVTSLDATREQVTVRDNVPMSGSTRRAMRLKVAY